MSEVLVLGARRSGVGVVAQSITEGLGGVCLDAGGRLAECLALPASMAHRVLSAADDDAKLVNLTIVRSILAERKEVRAVVVWRRGVDFVNSRLRTRPHADFISHCRLWTAARSAEQLLADAFPDRVLRLEQLRLRTNSSEVARELGGFLGVEDFRSEPASAALRGSEPGRAVAMADTPVCDVAKTSWSQAEIELFMEICGGWGEQAAAAFSPAAVERLRPLDLSFALLDRASRLSDLRVDRSDERHGGPVISWTSVPAKSQPLPSAFRLSGIAAGRRRRFRLRLEVLECDGFGEARFEIVESLSRRPLFAAPLALSAGATLNVDHLLPAHQELVDICFAQISGRVDRCRVAVDRARLYFE